MRLCGIAVVWLVIGCAAIGAQDDARVDVVASVKPTGRSDGPIVFNDPPDGFTARNTTVGELIRMAFGADHQRPLEGGPAWLHRERFDVLIKASTPLPNAAPGSSPPRQALVRSVLADRFRLQTHTEGRDLPIYALILDREDRHLGPRLIATSRSCTHDCLSTGYGFFKSDATTLANLTLMLSSRMGRRVDDRTGLDGRFAIDLEWAPTVPPPDGSAPPASDKPEIFTALREQLGLQLQSTRGAVEVLVIDRLERPSPD
jgi:uncharacterized protein (TIGR03435 family)